MNPDGTPKNLRPPWRKGEPSPNPSGRPKRLPISDTYALLVAEPIPEYLRRALKRKGIHLEPGATFADALGMQMLVRAINGDPKAAKEIRAKTLSIIPKQAKVGPIGADKITLGWRRDFYEQQLRKHWNKSRKMIEIWPAIP